MGQAPTSTDEGANMRFVWHYLYFQLYVGFEIGMWYEIGTWGRNLLAAAILHEAPHRRCVQHVHRIEGQVEYASDWWHINFVLWVVDYLLGTTKLTV